MPATISVNFADTNTARTGTSTNTVINPARLAEVLSSGGTSGGYVTLGTAQTITGAKTFSATIAGSINGNAATVTNGVYTNGAYANPSWITSLAGSKITGSVASADNGIPVGSIIAFARSSPPTGFLACDGSLLSTGVYSALFAVIGTAFGSGAGTFALPDLRGIFIRGQGSGNVAGTPYSGTFAARQTDQFRSHTHGISDPGHVHGGGYLSTGGANRWVGTGPNFSSRNNTGSAGTGITINAQGGTETNPANLTLLYCIKF